MIEGCFLYSYTPGSRFKESLQWPTLVPFLLLASLGWGEEDLTAGGGGRHRDIVSPPQTPIRGRENSKKKKIGV